MMLVELGANSVQPLFLPGNSETYQSAGEVQVQVLVIHKMRGHRRLY